MDDITPTPEDLARDLRQDLAALLRATPEAQWGWGEDDLWEFVHLAKSAGVAGVRRALAAQTCLSEIRDSMDRLKAVIGRGIEPFRGTTWTHDLPKDQAGLEQCVERLRRTDGTHADAAVIVWEQCQLLVREIDRLRSVIARHDLCHNLHGQVDARAFADGCADEQRKLYGCAPDADEVARLRAALERVACRDQGEVGPHLEEPRSAAIAREVLG